MVLSSCAKWFEPRSGQIGRAAPGHRVAIVDDDGVPQPAARTDISPFSGPIR